MQQQFQLSNKVIKTIADVGVEAIVLFGSRALGLARSMSDVDLGVLVKSGYRTQRNRRAIYDVIYDAVSAAFHEPMTFDIVFLDDASLELQVHVSRHGIILFEQQSHAFVAFKERVMSQAADFAPYRALFEQATLARI